MKTLSLSYVPTILFAVLQSTTDIHDIHPSSLREQPQLATANSVANLQWVKADGLFWDAPVWQVVRFSGSTSVS